MQNHQHLLHEGSISSRSLQPLPKPSGEIPQCAKNQFPPGLASKEPQPPQIGTCPNWCHQPQAIQALCPECRTPHCQVTLCTVFWPKSLARLQLRSLPTQVSCVRVPSLARCQACRGRAGSRDSMQFTAGADETKQVNVICQLKPLPQNPSQTGLGACHPSGQ